MPFTQLFNNLKKQQISQQQLKFLLQRMRQKRLNRIPLWKASTFTHLSTNKSRLQAYLVIIAGLIFIPSAIYDQYQEDPSKKYYLAVCTPIAILFVFAPFYLYRRSINKILASINYNIPERAFQLQTFHRKFVKVPCQNIQILYNSQQPNIVNQIIIDSKNKKKIYEIEGYGDWQSSQLFQYLIKNKGIDHIL